MNPQALEDPCEIDFELVCETDIPHYASEQDFEDMYACLEAAYEAHNNTYEIMYTSLSDDDYDDQVDSDAFNEEQPLDDWESLKGFVSLRTRLNSEEATWLANNFSGPDPFDHALCDIINDKSKRRKRLAVRTWAFTYGTIRTEEILGTFRLYEPNITLYEDINWP